MPADSRIRTVVLTVQYDTRSSYYLDWVEAFERSPLFAVTTLYLFRRDQRRAAVGVVAQSELVVALHSCSADTLEYIKPLSGSLKNEPFCMTSKPIMSKRSCRSRLGDGSMPIPAQGCSPCRTL